MKVFKVLLGDQVGCDTLDLCRRAAVQGGLGDGVGNVGADAADILLIYVLELVHALMPS